MKLYPAIDILGGRSVRLLFGDRNKVTDYGDPRDIAALWIKDGAEYLHVVDLDGAFSGAGVNLSIISEIAGAHNIKIQLGGGIRDFDALDRAFSAGVTRAIIGTAAYDKPDFLAAVVKTYGADRIAVGIDAKDGKAALRGWVDKSDVTPLELALRIKDVGVKTVIYTDISKDGALSGVNVAATKQLKAASGLELIASGGVCSLSDIRALNAEGIDGVILGKAIFERVFTVGQALEIIKC